MTIELEWEQLGKDGMQQRAKVPGGWLVRVHENVITHFGVDHQPASEGYEWRVAVTFVPDRFHLWGAEHGEMTMLDRVGMLMTFKRVLLFFIGCAVAGFLAGVWPR